MSLPTEFMPWLEPAWQTVLTRLRDDHLAHALLISGERGVGKRQFADWMAGLLVCERMQSPLAASIPLLACGHCKQCELVAAGTHPDIRIYTPEKSRMIRIDQVRALSAFAIASPQVAHRKLIIIDRADQLNMNAANALLKTLEEPADDVVLLLLHENGRPVMPTIRSRCQNLLVALPSKQQARTWLDIQVAALPQEQKPTESQCSRALELAGNAPRLALDYLTGEFMAMRDQALEHFRRFMKGQLTAPEAAKPFKALGLNDLLWLFEGWAADLARIAAGGQPRDSEAAEMLGFLARHNPGFRAHELLRMIHEARSASIYNVSPELEAERLLIAWQSLMPVRRGGVVRD